MERLRGELSEFVADVFASLPRRDQRRWGGCYLRGLMLDGRRKSVQPMAERLPDGNMQALQQFVNQSPWDPLPVRRRIAERLSRAIRRRTGSGSHGDWFTNCCRACMFPSGSRSAIGWTDLRRPSSIRPRR
ncbi:hypothetical protein Shyd_18480 [Streptomyces hydrogenans]|uniref:Transposase IS701-like DDE domain-containing protein n=1 Tax=Streptomyces hydrogenans TaxID=1873719 RepID=A0ABQ3P643_9ACTN|nr:hypothetical protein Shyd_18480 [Streptomyces hydrogenans]